MGLLVNLTSEPVFSLLCNEQWDSEQKDGRSISPEDSLDGKIILLDLPVKEFDKVGRVAQILFKYVWQRAMERRSPEGNERPVFLWADESQNFLHEHDMDYQATARSSRVCTVYITQNLPNYLSRLGSGTGEQKVYSFLGTMGTKIFHANVDIKTNEYAAELIGREIMVKDSNSTSISGNFSRTHSENFEREYSMPPEKFTQLLTGGEPNGNLVEGIIHKQGMPWGCNNRNYIKAIFKQTEQINKN